MPPEKIIDVCRAVGLLFRDHGDRYIRMYARLKFVVHRLGIERCRELVDEYLDKEGVDRSGFEEQPIEYRAGPAVPDRPLCQPDPRGTDGLAIQQIKIPKGELSSDHLAKIAELSEVFGDKHVYSTNRQNLELHGVDPRRLPQLRAEIQALGLETDDFYGLSDVVSCVGTTYCPLAVSSTHTMFDLLRELVRDPKYAADPRQGVGEHHRLPQFLLALSHCRHRPARAADPREGRLDRGLPDHRRRHAGAVRRSRSASSSRTIASAWWRRFSTRSWRSAPDEETLADSVVRLGVEPYRRAVEALEHHVRQGGQSAGAVGGHRPGRDAAGLQDASPATSLAARLVRPGPTCPSTSATSPTAGWPRPTAVNQEDNVLPGVLGRICTRPCEDRCRYQWTSIKGPVRICHLKRCAADGKGRTEPAAAALLSPPAASAWRSSAAGRPAWPRPAN